MRGVRRATSTGAGSMHFLPPLRHDQLDDELVILENYRRLIDSPGFDHPAMRRLLKDILSAEAEHQAARLRRHAAAGPDPRPIRRRHCRVH
jgi:hypothetical protein